MDDLVYIDYRTHDIVNDHAYKLELLLFHSLGLNSVGARLF